MRFISKNSKFSFVFFLLLIISILSSILVQAETFEEIYQELAYQNQITYSSSFYQAPQRIFLSKNQTVFVSPKTPYEVIAEGESYFFKLSTYAVSSITLDFVERSDVFLYVDEPKELSFGDSKSNLNLNFVNKDYASLSFSVIPLKPVLIVESSNDTFIPLNEGGNLNVVNNSNLNEKITETVKGDEKVIVKDVQNTKNVKEVKDSEDSAESNLDSELNIKTILFGVILILIIAVLGFIGFLVITKSHLLKTKKTSSSNIINNFKSKFSKKSVASLYSSENNGKISITNHKPSDTSKKSTLVPKVESPKKPVLDKVKPSKEKEIPIEDKELEPSNITSFDEYEALKNKLDDELKSKSSVKKS